MTTPFDTHLTYTDRFLVEPSKVGQRVRFGGYGGNVKKYHVGLAGTIVNVTRANKYVVELDKPAPEAPKTKRITDTQGAAKRINDDGSWTREGDLWPDPISVRSQAHIPILARVRKANGKTGWFLVTRIYCRWYQGRQYFGCTGYRWKPKLEETDGGATHVPVTDVLLAGGPEVLNYVPSKVRKTKPKAEKKKGKKKKGKGKTKTATRPSTNGQKKEYAITADDIKEARGEGLSWAKCAEKFELASPAAARKAWTDLVGTPHTESVLAGRAS